MEHNTVRVTRHSTEAPREISVEDAQQTILQFSMSQIVCVPYWREKQCVLWPAYSDLTQEPTAFLLNPTIIDCAASRDCTSPKVHTREPGILLREL